jgi:succinoglycan biosynthesis protein ExoL
MARVVFFAFDIAEAAQLRRIDSLRALGHGVARSRFGATTCGSGRARLAEPRARTVQQQSLRPAAAAACAGARGGSGGGGRSSTAARLDRAQSRHGAARRLRARPVSGPPPRLVYECLDIHGLFTRADAIGAAMRWAERRMLARCDLLILSSPGFLEHYFEPVQQVTTPVALLENKLWVGGPPPAPADPATEAETDAPFVLGWVGSLRCARSLEILAGPRARWGRVEIRLPRRGASPCPAGFRRGPAAHPNIRHAGAYRYPDALGDDLHRPAMRSGRRTFGRPGPTATGCCPTGSTRRAISAVRPSRSRGRRPGGGWRRTGWASRSGELAAALAPVLAPADPSAVATTDIGSDDADAESLRPTG